jgi:hypothetical protein
MLGVLASVQSDLGAFSSFASGRTGIGRPQLEAAAAGAATFLGQSPSAAKHAADTVFDAIDQAHSGQITEPQLAAYLSAAQSQASAKYQAAGALAGGFVHQLAGLLSAPTSLSA